MYFKKCDYLPKGYLINANGDVMSPNGKILKQSLSNSGYKFINIKNKGYFIHRAICFSFIPLVEGKLFVNHKNGDKMDNSISNLEWCTKSENLKHSYENGLKKYRPLHYKGRFGSEHNRSNSIICYETGIFYGSISEAARELKIHVSSISLAIKQKRSVRGYTFEKKD